MHRFCIYVIYAEAIPLVCAEARILSLSISQLRSAPELLTTAAEIQLPAAETRITHKILYPSYMLSLIHAFFIESAGRIFPLKSIRTHAESGDTRDCMHLCGIHGVTAYMYAARMQGSVLHFCTRRVASHCSQCQSWRALVTARC